MDYRQTVILIGAGFLAINAYLLGVGQLYFMACAIACIPVVSYAFCRASVGGLACKRTVHDRVYPGDTVQVTLEVENRSRWPRLGVRLRDDLPDWLVPDREPESYFPVIWPGRTVQTGYTAVARRRGAHSFAGVQATVSDPPGLSERTFTVAAPGEVIVYPLPLDVAALTLGGEVSYAEAGRSRGGLGMGGDFYAIREYVPGDALRRIHWRSTARRGSLAVIEYERTQAADLLVLLDLLEGSEVGEGDATTLETGVRAAASLLDFCRRGRGRGVLVCEDGRGLHQVAVGSEQDYLTALEVLARARADGKRHLSDLLTGIEAGLLAHYTPVLITSVPDPELGTALLAGRRGHLPAAALLIDPAGHQPAEGSEGLFASFARELAHAGAAVEVVRDPQDLGRALEALGEARP